MKNFIIEFIKQILIPLIAFICLWLFCIMLVDISPSILGYCFILSVVINLGQYKETEKLKSEIRIKRLKNEYRDK